MSAEHDLEPEPLTVEEVKHEARELGIDLVGVADAEAIEQNPPPGRNTVTPSDIVHGAASVVVLATRTTHGASSIRDATDTPSSRVVDGANEAAMSDLEEKSLDLLYFLEDHGYPSLSVSPEMTRTRQYDQMDDGPLSLPHCAVEAGLGTLGLNLQLITPEFGPRVILGAVVTTADLEPDDRITDGLCKGAKCGRCLLASPEDAVEYFDIDPDRLRPYTEPWGFDKLVDHIEGALEADTIEEVEEQVIKNRDTMMLWQSMLRGVGIYTGGTRGEDVCPVGEDWEKIANVQGDIPEATDEKLETLADYRRREAEGALPTESETYQRHQRWIGEIDTDYDALDTNDFTWNYLEEHDRS